MVKFAAATCTLLFTLLWHVTALGSETVLLDFASPQCPPCRQMEPLIQSMASAGYPIRKVDVTREPALGQQYSVTRVPCFVMLADGREVDRVVGATSQQRLELMFQRARDEIARHNPITRNQSPGGAPAVAASQQSWPGAPVAAQPQPPLGTLAMSSTPAVQGLPVALASVPNPAPNGAPAAAAIDPQFVPLVNSTVRLRVEGGDARSFGTGTIIDTRSGEALVITCGHIFRDSEGKAPVTVELFESTGGEVRSAGQVTGKVISYDLDRDIGLVSIRPTRPVAVAAVAPADAQIQQGDRAASVGCSHGENPTVLPTRITHLNRYQWPPNIEAQGAPVVGRSGGGLFNEQGQLVGVCFSADYEGNEGLYAALESIHGALDRIGMSEIYAKPAGDAAEGASIPVQTAAVAPPVVRGQEPLATPAQADPASAAGGITISNPAEQAALEEILARAATSEVICIIRPKEPGGQSEVITLDDVSPEFIKALASQKGAAEQTTTR